jgi:mannose-6-phosphate isomerase-like protein (cupin superfamily)
MNDKADAVEKWGGEGFFFTEAARGGSLPWRVGAAQLEGDALGPVRHAHDEASEYYFMFSGSANVETGSEQFVLEEGQLGYIPPNAPHNFLGPASDRDACLFCLIGPNFADNKWRVKDFQTGSESLRMAVGTPFGDEELPGGGTLSAEALTLEPSDGWRELTPAGFEVVYLVVDGALDIKLYDGLRGSIAAGKYVHVRDGLSHEIASAAGTKVLRMDCGFEAWRGVPTGDDV